MANSSQLSLRGWITAISLAGALTGVFWYMLGYSQVLDPEFYFARRASTDVLVTTKAPLNIAKGVIRDDLAEPSIPNKLSEWLDYRSRPTTTAVAILEPNAAIRLAAPRPTEDAATDAFSISSLSGFAWSRDQSSNSNVQPVSLSRQTETDSTEYAAVSKTAIGTTQSETWPAPTQLVDELTHLKNQATDASVSNAMGWANEVLSTIDGMTAMHHRDPAIAVQMDQLQELATSAIQGNATNSELDPVSQFQSRVAHGMLRRIAIWKAVWDCESVSAPTRFVSTRPTFEMKRLADSVARLKLDMTSTGDISGWKEYLLLDELERLSTGSEFDVSLAMSTAQVVLTRITSSNVSSVQRQFLDSEGVRELAECIQPLAVAPVDYRSLLVDLEQLEGDSEHRSRSTLISAMQSLRFAYDPKQIAVSQAIDTYYRNANVRIAVSEKLINRMLPENKTIQRPVRQTILGADTRGNSNVNTTLRVRLTPDQNAWNLNLELDGKIQSNTRSSRGPATFFNSSSSAVTTSRAIRITSQGIQIQGSQANVQSQDALRSLETNYDGLPFVGDMVRYFAQKEFKEKRGPARRMMQRSIATQTDTEFDKQLESKVGELEKSFEQKLIGPLRNLNLNPLVMDLQTTADRLIARYRLASDNNLAANTPRPQAPADSLLSVQIHQSAMNNGFGQLGLSDREWSLLELAQSIAKQFGQEPIDQLSTDVPSDVRIRFDGERPILVEFLDGHLRLTLRIAKLSQPGRIELNDFIIRTTYAPAVSGLEAELVLEGAPSIDGRLSMREKIPLRVIFGKVFTARSTIPLVTPQLFQDPRSQGLAISQLILEENWLAIAISEQASPHVAYLQSLQTQR